MKSLLLLFFPAFLFGTQIIVENSHAFCEEINLKRELKIYKDPSLFLPNLSLIYSNPRKGWKELLNENPLLTSLNGSVHLMRLGPPREFKNFGAIARLYELSEPRFKPKFKENEKQEREIKNQVIVPIKICGVSDPYSDSLGFVLVSDLNLAQTSEDSENAVLPTSTLGNPIPKLKKQE